MEATRRDYRPLGLGIVAITVLCGLWLLLGSRPRNQFEREHLRAEAANPKGLRIEIATADNRSEYREDELIYIVPHFSSAIRYRYKVETSEGKSASAVDYFHISNGQVALRNLVGIFCCFSRLVGLDDEPYSPSTVTPLKLPPGRYEVYLTTRRVFAWDIGSEEYTPSSFEVASNLLKIRVVPKH